jgi:Fic family protein
MYIHQRENWTDFKWDNERLSPLLGNVRHLQGKMFGHMESLGFPLTEEATLISLTLDAVDTSRMEGEFLNPEQVRSSIARKLGIEEADFVASPRNVDGIVDVLLDATQHFSVPLSEERLWGWHNSLFPTGFSGYMKIDVAKYRKVDMKVVSGAFGREKIHFEAPPHDKVKAEMARFIQWFNEENTVDALYKAAIVHLWFVTIHPFDDGNGRIARALTDMQLARSDNSSVRFYSMSNQFYREHKAYNNIIEQTQKGTNEITMWLEWFICCFERALLASEEHLKIILDKARFWDKYKTVVINDRQRLMINRLYDCYNKEKGFLRTSSWAKKTNCSTDTALRDIQDLVAKGMLTVEAGGKKTNYLLASPSGLRIPLAF